MSNFPHNWVEVRVVPVSAIDNGNGQFEFMASEEAIEIAEEDLHYICYACKAHPGDEAAMEPCKGGPTGVVPDDL